MTRRRARNPLTEFWRSWQVLSEMSRPVESTAEVAAPALAWTALADVTNATLEVLAQRISLWQRYR